MRKGTENLTISKQVDDFWSVALSMLKYAGKYDQEKKLLSNLNDSSNFFIVESILYKYYGGDIKNVSKAIDKNRAKVFEYIKIFNNLCEKYDLLKIRNADLFLNRYLSHTTIRDYYEKRIKFYRKQNLVTDFQTIESDRRHKKKNL